MHCYSTCEGNYRLIVIKLHLIVSSSIFFNKNVIYANFSYSKSEILFILIKTNKLFEECI